MRVFFISMALLGLQIFKNEYKENVSFYFNGCFLWLQIFKMGVSKILK